MLTVCSDQSDGCLKNELELKTNRTSINTDVIFVLYREVLINFENVMYLNDDHDT